MLASGWLYVLLTTLQNEGDSTRASNNAQPQAEFASTAPADPVMPGGDVAGQVIDLLGPTVTRTSVYGFAVLMLGIIGGLAAGRIIRTALISASDRLKHRGWAIRGAVFRHAAGPAGLALFTLGLAIGFQGLYLAPQVRPLVLKFIGLLYIVAIGWFLYNLVELIDFALRRLTARSATRLDDAVVTLLRKALRIFLLIMLVLFIAQNFFGAQITAWLAGLGIAGLAVSLAAQDSVKNLFGSMTVLIERPFTLGDRIIFNGFDGTVEQIGFRSSKIRLGTGHLLTVPNMRFTDGAIENITARPVFVRSLNLQIAYDTAPAQVERALSILRGILAQPDIAEPIDLPERPPRVHFSDFGQAGLTIAVAYAYSNSAGRDWWAYQQHTEQVNMRILREFNDAGIELAFPTQTLFLAGDAKRQLAVRVLRDEAAS